MLSFVYLQGSLRYFYSYLSFIITFKHSSVNTRSQGDLLLNPPHVNIDLANHISDSMLL